MPRFLALLHTRSLYLRRADGFTDRLEGALFPGFRKSINAAHANGVSKESADDFYRKARTGCYVSCWSLGPKDNMALWHLYGGAKTCLAVTTTVGRLIRLALSAGEAMELRRVRYVDHRHVATYVVGGYTDVLRYKNEAYAYEKEVRLVVPRLGRTWKRNPIGMRIRILDADALVRGIVLAPEAEPWFIEAVKGLCARYKLKAPIRQSILATIPT